MPEDFLPLCLPSLDHHEISEVVKVLRSGWIKSGPIAERFEQEFVHVVGAHQAISVSSATAGFLLLMQALHIGPGAEVIIPSFTWPSFVNMITLLGATPVFADIIRDTFQIDPTSVSRVVTPKTRAVVAVHFAGHTADLDPLREICSFQKIHLIEDAAHAILSEYKGRRVGSFSNPAVFSFNATKNITTGEGGMISLADPELGDRIRLLRNLGIDRNAWRAHGKQAAKYDMIEPGWKCCLTDIQAAIGLAQLRKLSQLQKKREHLVSLYLKEISCVEDISVQRKAPYVTRHAWHLFPILFKLEHNYWCRDWLRDELMKRGIGSGIHYLPVHSLSYYKGCHELQREPLANTNYVGKRILSLPLFPDMLESDVLRVVNTLNSIISS